MSASLQLDANFLDGLVEYLLRHLSNCHAAVLSSSGSLRRIGAAGCRHRHRQALALRHERHDHAAAMRMLRYVLARGLDWHWSCGSKLLAITTHQIVGLI